MKSTLKISEKENADAKFVTDVSQINTGNIGSHEIVVKVGKKNIHQN